MVRLRAVAQRYRHRLLLLLLSLLRAWRVHGQVVRLGLRLCGVTLAHGEEVVRAGVHLKASQKGKGKETSVKSRNGKEGSVKKDERP